jgi:hypothetical protein
MRPLGAGGGAALVLGAVLMSAPMYGATSQNAGEASPQQKSAAPPASSPQQDSAEPPRRAAGPGEVALIGCVELESDYRKRKDAGRGGVLGTGVGASNEYVLTMARPAQAVSTPGSQAGGQSSAAGAVGTAGSVRDYLLTGESEEQLKRAVGRQIEVVGKIENREAAADDVDDLPRVTVALWHPVSDFCPAK